MKVTPARRVAHDVVRRTFEEGAYTDRALRAHARRAGLRGRELAFATALAYGAVQRRATLDHLIATLAQRPPERLDPPALAALRLGLLQLAFLDGVPDHAAVSQSVELAPRRARGLVNAVLRRAVREAPALVDALRDDTPARAALRHSHPEWVALLWWDALGADQARALMEADNRPAETAVRVNTLVAEPAAVARALGARRVPELPEALVLDAPGDLAGSAEFRGGAITPQSRASMLVARVLDPRPGERVLDLCSAPGAKATHLAALMEGRGEVVAVERDPARADELRETRERLRATSVRVVEGDARDDHGRDYDRVLVDPPCSGLGTLRGRPDLRWRATPARAAELAVLQREILAAAARAVRPGGTVVYSTCTLNPAENEEVVEVATGNEEVVEVAAGNEEVAEVATVGEAAEGFAAGAGAVPDLRAQDLQADHPLWKHPRVADHLLLLPHRDGTDGFFVARLRREA